MLQIYLWKRILIWGIVAIGVFLALPNAFYTRVETHNDAVTAIERQGATPEREAAAAGWPSFMPSGLVNLGLDLRGGAHLLAEVQVEDVYAQRLEALWPEVRDALRPEHWDAFWLFYQDTGSRKWGHPYLTREAFDLFGTRMKDDVVLILAYEGDMAIAGALNFAGPQALYGRYWGTLVDRPFLHFEICYYQAIDAAIARGLPRVEAGAQGSHKLARGYEPVTTHSAHFIPHEGFRQAVADYLRQERAGIGLQQEALREMAPFRKG